MALLVEGDRHEVVDLETAQQVGFLGTSPDATPRQAYTLAGVAAGMPTPETTPEQRR